MFDLIIRGGDVVTPQGVVRCDVAVAGETIAAIAAAGALSAESATREIDARGHIVMPGGIDPHVHLHHVWIKPDGTPLVTAGPEQVGRAALFGGTTTFIDFAYWRDGASARQAIETRDQDFVGKSPCDWAYHIMLHSEPPPEFSEQLAEAIRLHPKVVRQALRLAFLSPDVTSAILEGRQPCGLSLARIPKLLPLLWTEHRSLLG